VRIARLARVAGGLEMFDSLRIILRSISASAPILLWATLVLFSIGAMVGLAINSWVINYVESPDNPEEVRKQMFLYFGTFSRSIITIMELTLGNFVPVMRFLSENVSEIYGYMILVYKLVVGFAIIRVIGGVFLHETFKTASSDNDLMIVQRKRAQEKHQAKMRHFMIIADTNNDHHMSKSEFHAVLQNKAMKMWLAAQDIDVQDIELLYDLMDNGDGQLSCPELCHGISRLKGPARSFDIYGIMHMIKKLSSSVDRVEAKISKHAVVAHV